MTEEKKEKLKKAVAARKAARKRAEVKANRFKKLKQANT